MIRKLYGHFGRPMNLCPLGYALTDDRSELTYTRLVVVAFSESTVLRIVCRFVEPLELKNFHSTFINEDPTG